MESVGNLVDDLPLAAVSQPLGDVPKVSIGTYRIGGETKMAILDHPDGSIDWSLPVLPKNSSLEFVTAVAPNCAGTGPGVRFQVTVREGSTDRVIFDYLESNRASATSERWISHEVDLSDLASRSVNLVFRTKPGLDGDYTCAWALWGSPMVVAQHAVVDVRSDMPFRQMLPGRVANLLLWAMKQGG